MPLPQEGKESTVTFRLPDDDGKYTLNIAVQRNFDVESCDGVNLNGSLRYESGDATSSDEQEPPKKKAKDEEVGYVKCYLIDRDMDSKSSGDNFYLHSESISDESWEVARMFCDKNGVANRIDHPAMAPGTDARSSDGAFLHVYLIEVRCDHHGRDLGLRMIHEVMMNSIEYWNLAVVVPAVLGFDFSKWKENDILGIGKRVSRFNEPEPPALTDAQLKSLTTANTKIARHFGRMGFVQAGSVGDKAGTWFITNEMYFGKRIFTSECSENTMKTWIPKSSACDRIHVHEIAVQKEDKKPSELDKELYMHVAQTMAVKNRKEACDVDRLKSILQRGGNADAMIHVVCQYWHREWLIDLLIELGGSVDAIGFKGMRPLHSAVAASSPSGVRQLLSRGANTSLVNALGETPLQYAINIEQEEKDRQWITAWRRKSDGTSEPMNKKKQEDATTIRRLLESWTAAM